MTTSVFSASFKKHRQENTKTNRSHRIKFPRAPWKPKNRQDKCLGRPNGLLNTLWGTKARKREPSGSLLAPKDVEFGSFGAPKVLKMDPLGTPLGRQIGILEPVGSIV